MDKYEKCTINYNERKKAYIGKSRKSLFIPLLDLIKWTRFFYSLFLPAFLWRQAKVVTISAAVVQILSSLPVWFSVKVKKMKRDHFDKDIQLSPVSNTIQTHGLEGGKKIIIYHSLCDYTYTRSLSAHCKLPICIKFKERKEFILSVVYSLQYNSERLYSKWWLLDHS